MNELELAALAHTQVAAGMPTLAALRELNNAFGKNVRVEQLMSVVAESGASSQLALNSLTQHFEFRQRVKIQTEIILSSINQTKRTLLWLPLAMVTLGQFLGFDSIVVLMTEPLGWLSLAICAVLTWLASRSLGRQTALALLVDEDPGFEFELLTLCLESGMSWGQALALVGATGGAEFSTPNFENNSISLASQVTASANSRRQQYESQKSQQLARLPEKLVTSTGLYLLPACILVTVVPTGLGILKTMNI